MSDYTGFGGQFRYYRDKLYNYLSPGSAPDPLPGYKPPGAPKSGSNDMLGDMNAVVPTLGKGAFNTKAALTPVVGEIINSALSDKSLTDKADALMNSFGTKDPSEFQIEFFKKIFEATNKKFGPVNNPNPPIVTHGVLNAMEDLVKKNDPMALKSFFEKQGGVYQLTPEGVKGLAEPAAGYILNPRPIPGLDDNKPATNQNAPAAAPKSQATPPTGAKAPNVSKQKLDSGLLNQTDRAKPGTSMLDQTDKQPSRKPAITPKH